MTRPRSLRRAAGVTVVIPAGGTGSRLGGRLPKQFQRLGGSSILVTTVRQFAVHPAVHAIVVTAPSTHVERARQLLRSLARRRGVARRVSIRVVTGGAERQESVWRGIQASPEATDLIMVHDAVRPFVTRTLIDAVLHAAAETGAAICALPIAETVKRVHDGLVEASLDRSVLWTAQTPQAFRAELLREAHDKARRDGSVGTDDAMLVERLGHPVRVVPGSPVNVKITTPDDLRRGRRSRR
jgi:2-C-methyl-D-erythritol 4-phosphate cytidylyltransferase